MKDSRENTKRCVNEGCGKPAEEGSIFCASCGLEWALFHRDVRGQKLETPGVKLSR